MSFSQNIIHWYETHKRDLPWRNTHDPYVIWLSEVILQQTRVDQGLPYFHLFLERFPTIEAFAAADEDEVLRLWQGLGYYSRARNMHKAAQMVLKEFDGEFPHRFMDLIRLPGVGPYTAAAVSSFAANEPRAVVDGNVYRVLARYFGIDTPINSSTGQKEFQELANHLIHLDAPGKYNQAIMEFGALQCTPTRPDCDVCVLGETCLARAKNLVGQLPVKLKARPRRDRFFNYLLVQDSQESRILMNKRAGGDIWENLWELPLIETDSATSVSDQKFTRHFGDRARVTHLEGPVKHILSHQTIYANFFSIHDVSKEVLQNLPWNYVEIKELNNLAKPKLIYSFLDKYLD